jgi:hypothetical protein
MEGHLGASASGAVCGGPTDLVTSVLDHPRFLSQVAAAVVIGSVLFRVCTVRLRGGVPQLAPGKDHSISEEGFLPCHHLAVVCYSGCGLFLHACAGPGSAVAATLVLGLV